MKLFMFQYEFPIFIGLRDIVASRYSTGWLMQEWNLMFTHMGHSLMVVPEQVKWPRHLACME